MDKAMTIEEFNALLTSDRQSDDDSLVKGLSELMTIEEPEDIAVLALKELGAWSNWSAV